MRAFEEVMDKMLKTREIEEATLLGFKVVIFKEGSNPRFWSWLRDFTYNSNTRMG